jgi:hypothetical protein
MVEMYNELEIIKNSTGFLAWFSGGAGRTLFSDSSSIVEIDIKRGNKKLAALVPRGNISRSLGPDQKNTSAEKFTTFSRRFPLSEEEGTISADQLEFRKAGENPYQAASRMARMRALASEHHMEHINRHVRLFEFLASESILKGTMPSIIGTTDADLIYDFKRKATHTVTVGTAWDASGDPLGDIDGACDLIRLDSFMSPDFILIGTGGFDAFIKDTTTQTFADNRRYELIEVSTNNPVPAKYNKFVESGMTARGRLRTPAGYTLWMFTYLSHYVNSAGSDTEYMPEDWALVGSTEARCDRYFGPPEVLPNIPSRQAFYRELFGFSPDTMPGAPQVKNASAVINPAMFYNDAYADVNWKTVTIRTQAAPIYAPVSTDAFVTLKGLTTP